MARFGEPTVPLRQLQPASAAGRSSSERANPKIREAFAGAGCWGGRESWRESKLLQASSGCPSSQFQYAADPSSSFLLFPRAGGVMRAYYAGRVWWRSLVGYRPAGCVSILPARGIHAVAPSCSTPQMGLVQTAISKLGAQHGSRSDLWTSLLQERLCYCHPHISASVSLLQQRRGFLGVGDGDEEPGASSHFEEDRIIGYSPEQAYAVVAAVDMYEDFVPWCRRSQVLWRKDDEALDAELEVGFKLFSERYISHVELKRPHMIKTTVSQSTLFDHLNNEWFFKPGPTPNSCHLHFKVDFQFRSPLYRQVANMFCNEVQARMVSSFEERCRVVYGLSMVH